MRYLIFVFVLSISLSFVSCSESVITTKYGSAKGDIVVKIQKTSENGTILGMVSITNPVDGLRISLQKNGKEQASAKSAAGLTFRFDGLPLDYYSASIFLKDYLLVKSAEVPVLQDSTTVIENIVIKDFSTIPDSLELMIYPNPVSTICYCSLSLNTTSDRPMSIDIYKPDGTKLKNIVKSNIEPGVNKFPVDVSDLPTGVYFVVAAYQNNNQYAIANLYILK